MRGVTLRPCQSVAQCLVAFFPTDGGARAEGAGLHKRLAVIGILLTLFLVGSTPAHGQEAPCYPPPCASIPATGGVEPFRSAGTTGGAIPVVTEQERSSAPFVVSGLLMVSLSFGLIVASRRMGLAKSAMEVVVGHAKVGHEPARMRPAAELSDVH